MNTKNLFEPDNHSHHSYHSHHSDHDHIDIHIDRPLTIDNNMDGTQILTIQPEALDHDSDDQAANFENFETEIMEKPKKSAEIIFINWMRSIAIYLVVAVHILVSLERIATGWTKQEEAQYQLILRIFL